MAEGNASVAALRFGRTMRRDLWWLQPLLTSAGLGAFVVYATWAAFQGATTTSAPTSRRSTRRSSSATRRTPGSGRKPGWWPGVAAVLAGAPDPLGAGRLPPHLLLLPRRVLQGVLGRSARRAPSASRASATAASARFPLILQNVHRYFLYLALCSSSSSPTTSGRRSGSPTRRRARASSASASGTLVLRQRRAARRLHARLPLAAAPRRRRHRPALGKPPLRQQRLRLRRAASTAATCSGPG